jgi:membrane associated rhomboid family serine protease
MGNIELTWIILLATLIVSYRGFQDSSLFSKLAGNPYRIKQNKEYYRLFSHMLLHSDWIHLALNMFVFYSFGGILEMYFAGIFGDISPLAFLFLYAGGGAAGMLPLIRKYGDSPYFTCVGASGAVSAILMAYMFAFPLHEILFLFIPMPAFLGVIVFFLIERLMQRYGRAAIAHEAHIGGAIFGILFVIISHPAALPNFVSQVSRFLSLQ